MSRNRYLSIIPAIVVATLFVGATATAANARPGWLGGVGQSWDSARPQDVDRSDRRVPLQDILRNLRSQFGGHHQDAELRDGGPRGEVYLIKWLTDDGRKIDFLVDADSGAILDQRGR